MKTTKERGRPSLRCPKYGWMACPDGLAHPPFLIPRPVSGPMPVLPDIAPDQPAVEVCEFVLSNYASNIAVCRTHKVTQDGPPQIFAGRGLSPAPSAVS